MIKDLTNDFEEAEFGDGCFEETETNKQFEIIEEA